MQQEYGGTNASINDVNSTVLDAEHLISRELRIARAA